MMKLLRVLGVVLVICAPVATYRVWDGNRLNLAVLQDMQSRPLRDKTDSAMYASAVYHATPARASEVGRWGLTGYVTLGVFGTVVGIGLVVFSHRRLRRGEVVT